jgi:TRAP transporter TAXI family solute receptor
MTRGKLGSAAMILALALAMSAAPAFGQTKFITIVTGGTAGTAYACGTILANTFNAALADTKYKWTAQSSGGSLENLSMLQKKETLMGGAGAAPSFYAYEGAGMFQGKQIRNIRFITALWPEFTQIVCAKSSNIKSWKDLKGKKVAVGPPAGGGTFYMPMLLKGIADMTFDDIKPEYLSYGDAAQALQNGLIDAFYSSGGIPTTAVAQAYASRVNINLLETSEEELENLKKVGPFFIAGIIPAGTYKGQEQDIKTSSMNFTLLGIPELDDDIVYQMLEVMYVKKLSDIQKQHHSLSSLSLERALEGLAGAPLHEGAVKFYRAHGVKVPESLIPPEMK